MAAKNPIIPTNYIGQQFGRLTITGVIPRTGRKPPRFTYNCACGTQGNGIIYSILKGTTQSCGCLANELSAVRQYKHGMKRTPEQHAYQDMMRRCYDPKRAGYKDYGGRGIYVCERWRGHPEMFHRDMGKRPTPKHSIDRKNNDGPYEPDNCHWATRTEQNRNKCKSVWLTFDGRTLHLLDWAELLGIGSWTLYKRHKAGMTVERILQRGRLSASRSSV